jgi:hypothetical protein
MLIASLSDNISNNFALDTRLSLPAKVKRREKRQEVDVTPLPEYCDFAQASEPDSIRSDLRVKHRNN